MATVEEKNNNETKEKFDYRMADLVEKYIIKSRWILVFMYVTLITLTLAVTCFDFVGVQFGLLEDKTLSMHLFRALELLDITMVANLIWLISAGSFYVFVYIETSIPSVKKNERPRCLVNLSSGILKEKMSGSIVGIAGVYLLELFLHIATGPDTANKVWQLIALGGMFVVMLLAFNYTNKADHHSHNKEEQKQTRKETENEKTHV